MREAFHWIKRVQSHTFSIYGKIKNVSQGLRYAAETMKKVRLFFIIGLTVLICAWLLYCYCSMESIIGASPCVGMVSGKKILVVTMIALLTI